jgi:hypothetical protein
MEEAKKSLSVRSYWFRVACYSALGAAVVTGLAVLFQIVVPSMTDENSVSNLAEFCCASFWMIFVVIVALTAWFYGPPVNTQRQPREETDDRREA